MEPPEFKKAKKILVNPSAKDLEVLREMAEMGKLIPIIEKVYRLDQFIRFQELDAIPVIHRPIRAVHTFEIESRLNPATPFEAKGGPLSVRIASGIPYASNACSKDSRTHS